MKYTIELSDEQVETLKRYAKRRTGPERSEKRGEEFFIPEEDAGGNFDDAYQLGIEDQTIEEARSLLDLCGIAWKE